MSIAVGIDLGSTYSVISYVKTDGSVEVIPNCEGNRITPSVFAVDESGNYSVGDFAVDYESICPERVVRLVKRKMSSGFEKSYGFEPSLHMSPCQISSEILKKLKRDAEQYLGQDINKAVITVPAYFNQDQRQATKIAGELAGLDVLRIINEPTAASLAYGLDKKNDSTILVYDLGGGTFDVTILRLMDGIDFHVLSTSGNTSLGGADFDNELINLILEKLNIKYEDAEFSEIRALAEKTKKSLSQLESVNVRFNKLSTSITRDEFEERINLYLEKTKECIDIALSDAKLNYSDIDEVVFVGGSTRIPLVYKRLQEWTGKKPNKSINPDEAVSIGAAIQASVLSGNSDKEVYLIDVCPLSLGIETQGGVMTVMIKRNTQIPTEHTETFTTAFDNQSDVEVRVYQGERPQTINNHFMGQFKLENIPLATRGVPKINVKFQVDADGITTVYALDEVTGNQKSMTLSGKISDDEMSRMIKEANENKIDDERFIKIANYKALLYDCQVQLHQLLSTNLLSSEEVSDLKDLDDSLTSGLDSDNLELLCSLYETSKDVVKDLSNKLYEKADDYLVKRS